MRILNGLVGTGAPVPGGSSNDAPMTTNSHGSRGGNRRWVWTAVVCVLLVLVAVQWGAGPSAELDDFAQYLMHARALSEGRAYTDIGYIYSPFAPFIGPPKASPGLPLTLAPLILLFGESVTLLKVVSALCFLAFTLIAGAYFGRRSGPWLGAGTTLVSGVALVAVHAPSDLAAQDLGVAAAIWGVILVGDRVEEWSPARTLGLTALGIVALVYRTAALPLIPAMLAFGIVHWRRPGGRVLVPVVVWSLVFWWVFGTFGAGSLPDVELPVATEVSYSRSAYFLYQVPHNAWAYRLALFESQLYPFPWDSWNDAYHLVAAFLTLVGVGAWARRDWNRLPFIFTGAYVSFLLLAPVVNVRYAWPLFPVLAYVLLRGVQVIVCALGGGRARAEVRRGVAAGAVLLSTLAVGVHVAEPHDARLVGDEALQEVFGVLARIDAESRVRAVYQKPRLLAWGAGVEAMAPIGIPNGRMEEVLESRGITHVVVETGGPGRPPPKVLQKLEPGETARLVDVFTNERFRVLRFEAASQ